MTASQRAIEAGARAAFDALPLTLGDFDDLRDAGKNNMRDVARAVIAAYREYLAAEGLVVVPAVPTQTMIEAGCDSNPTQWNEGTDLGFAADVASDVYRSMITAAQQEQNDAGE